MDAARLDGLGQVGPSPARPFGANRTVAAPGPGFQEALQQAQDVNLSRHALKRVERRDLDLDPARLARLNRAIERAAEKGSRNSVVMLDDLAVVVDVRGRTVVTAMTQQGGNGRIFTNIDSVVIG